MMYKHLLYLLLLSIAILILVSIGTANCQTKDTTKHSLLFVHRGDHLPYTIDDFIGKSSFRGMSWSENITNVYAINLSIIDKDVSLIRERFSGRVKHYADIRIQIDTAVYEMSLEQFKGIICREGQSDFLRVSR